MLETDGLLLFVLATLTLNVTPGPDMLYVIARAAGQGRSAGVVSALGIAAGLLVHTLLVAGGLAGLLLTAPAAFEGVKYAGAAYLICLGVRALMSCKRAEDAPRVAQDSLGSVFVQGALTNLLNPKVALFFLAFLPQFADGSRGPVASQILLLGLLFNLLGTTVNVVVALLASFAGGRFKSRVGDAAALRWLTGGALIGLGVRLALLERR
jgi:threonine/homoserine/homoserine lactone efflux protein